MKINTSLWIFTLLFISSISGFSQEKSYEIIAGYGVYGINSTSLLSAYPLERDLSGSSLKLGINFFKKPGEKGNIEISYGATYSFNRPDVDLDAYQLDFLSLSVTVQYRFGRAKIQPITGLGLSLNALTSSSGWENDDSFERTKNRFTIGYHIKLGVLFIASEKQSIALRGFYSRDLTPIYKNEFETYQNHNKTVFNKMVGSSLGIELGYVFSITRKKKPDIG